MNFQIKKIFNNPILILIAVNILIGLFVFRDFGLTWDEPLFYSYGDALGYAYSPKEWTSGNFDLYNSYGKSGDDHKNRGPAYLLLAREFVYGFEKLGADEASAWHLVNFLFLQLGIYFLYRISTRWMSKSAAFFAALFFSTQPLVWGHAFINPKDPPFLTFFLASLCLGFEMVDAITENTKDKTKKILLASFFLGIATSIRILGPLAGLLVFIYFISKAKNIKDISAWRSIVLYGLLSILVMVVTWPYLWENPIRNFIEVVKFMSDNPTHLPVLFMSKIYSAGDLPRRYLPFMFATTLTEPTWFLFLFGLVYGFWKLRKEKREYISLSLVFSYFLILIAYVLVRKPALYDGIRHFLFILPPIFIFIGFSYQFILDRISSAWLRAGLGFLLILPGIIGIAKLHPYEYAYYNSFIGGTSGAFRKYETEYWLTCYKEAIEQLNDQGTAPVNLFVYREPYIAKYYANPNINVFNLRSRSERRLIKPGDLALVSTRTNEDKSIVQDGTVVLETTNNGAEFCVIKQIP
jgi:4-amino-4-deoxy-L-arabinose transferase-like glycosyltransferase